MIASIFAECIYIYIYMYTHITENRIEKVVCSIWYIMGEEWRYFTKNHGSTSNHDSLHGIRNGIPSFQTSQSSEYPVGCTFLDPNKIYPNMVG